MKQYLEKLKRFLTETTDQLAITTDVGISDKLIALQSQLIVIKGDIEAGLEKETNIVFGMFSMKNRVDIVDGMDLAFSIGNRLFSTKANREIFQQDLNNFCNNVVLGSLDYFYYDINESTNSMTFYFAVRSEMKVETEISLLVGTKKYNFGTMETNQFYPRFDDAPPLNLITPNNKGFALSYNIKNPENYVSKLFDITAKGGELADLRFLNPKTYELTLDNLTAHFKLLGWKSIMTQAKKLTLLPDGNYKIITFK